jgi:hypothetical protein
VSAAASLGLCPSTPAPAAGSPFGNRVQLTQRRDGPAKSVPTGRPGVADGATRTNLWAHHQLGARAKSLPFEPRWGSAWCQAQSSWANCRMPSAQSTGTRTVTLHSRCASGSARSRSQRRTRRWFRGKDLEDAPLIVRRREFAEHALVSHQQPLLTIIGRIGVFPGDREFIFAKPFG